MWQELIFSHLFFSLNCLSFSHLIADDDDDIFHIKNDHKFITKILRVINRLFYTSWNSFRFVSVMVSVLIAVFFNWNIVSTVLTTQFSKYDFSWIKFCYDFFQFAKIDHLGVYAFAMHGPWVQ